MRTRSIEGYRAYLDALRTAAESEPVVHAAQLAVIDRELAIARRAADSESHAALGGSPFELTRAAWIDRVVGHARIAAALDDPWAVRACSIELAATLVGATAEAMRDALVEVSPRVQALRADGVESLGCFSRLMIGLVRMQAERRPTELGELRRDVAACARIVGQHDRLELEHVESRPRHRWRMPWCDPSPLARWIAGAVPTLAADAVPEEPRALLRDVDAMARRWREQLAARTGPNPPTDLTVFDEAAAALRAGTIAAGCRASITALVQPWLDRQRVWPEPIVEQHARRLVADCARVTTPTAIDLVSMHAAGCLAIEATWWQLLAGCVGGPLRAALVATYDPGPASEASIAAARDAACALVGEADPWRVPWFERLVASNLLPHAVGDLDGLGAFDGEAGFDLLSPWRTWTAIRIAAGDEVGLDRARVLTETDLPSDAGRRRVRLWDREVALDALDRATVVSARPTVPGFVGRFETDLA